MTRVLIVDDHAIVRQGLRRILEESRDIKGIGEAPDGAEAMKMMRSKKWDIVLLDISMPVKNGIDTLKQILSDNKYARVIILSMYPEEQYAVRIMKAGAAGYMTKDVAPEQLIEAIRKVMGGNKHISQNLSELLLQDCSQKGGQALHDLLSDREFQVLRMLGSGKQVSEIAVELSLSVKTVSTYRTHILEKMKLENNSRLTRYVVENGLVLRD
jgi:two-component system, NarL family, invasion response regulator UvrY